MVSIPHWIRLSYSVKGAIGTVYTTTKFQSHIGYDSATQTAVEFRIAADKKSFNPTLDTTQLLSLPSHM